MARHRRDGCPMSASPMTAVALDGGVELSTTAKGLKWPEIRRYAYGSVFQVPDTEQRLWVFRFGAVVLDGVAELDSALLDVVAEAAGRKILPDTADTYQIEVISDPSQKPQVRWERVQIPEGSAAVRNAVALLIGQSTALERYEHSADQLLEEALVLSRQLERRGRAPRGDKKELKRIGRITSDRLELATLFYILDRPEEAWEDPAVDHLYGVLFQNLELGDRHQATLRKLEAVERVTDMVVTLWHGRMSNSLEWAVVILIILEIVLPILEKI